MKLAIFDIDGTLLTGASSERRFALLLLRKGLIGPRQALSYLWFFATRWPRYGVHTPKKNKGYLAGLAVGRVNALIEKFVAESLVPALDAATVSVLRQHLDQGDRVVLLSGTLQPIADTLLKHLGGHLAIGTGIVTHDGEYGRGGAIRHPFGVSKLRLVETLCEETGIPLTEVIAYGDSIHDRWLLSAAGSARVVNPDAALVRLATEKGWQITNHQSSTRSALQSSERRAD